MDGLNNASEKVTEKVKVKKKVGKKVRVTKKVKERCIRQHEIKLYYIG